MTQTLHPIFASILAAHGMPQSAPPQPETFRANCGRRRVFLSQSDADAYDRGFSDHPHTPACGINGYGPGWSGYYDREDEVMAQFDRDNDWSEDGERRGWA